MTRALQGTISEAGVDLISYVPWISITKYDYTTSFIPNIPYVHFCRHSFFSFKLVGKSGVFVKARTI